MFIKKGKVTVEVKFDNRFTRAVVWKTTECEQKAPLRTLISHLWPIGPHQVLDPPFRSHTMYIIWGLVILEWGRVFPHFWHSATTALVLSLILFPLNIACHSLTPHVPTCRAQLVLHFHTPHTPQKSHTRQIVSSSVMLQTGYRSFTY